MFESLMRKSKPSMEESAKEPFVNSQLLTEFKDPFNSEHVTLVTFWVRPHDKYIPHFTADVDFKNGNTKGCQRIEAEDFITLVTKVQDFIKRI